MFWKRGWEDLLFSEVADFQFEVVILKFGVVVTANVGVVKGVVVQTGQRGFMSRVRTQKLPRITGPISSLGSGWRSPPGHEDLLLGTSD